MNLYRKKPVVISAAQWFPSLEVHGVCRCKQHDFAHVHTLEGVHVVSPGDYIVRGVVGEYYPVKPDIFELTYDPVTE